MYINIYDNVSDVRFNPVVKQHMACDPSDIKVGTHTLRGNLNGPTEGTDTRVWNEEARMNTFFYPVSTI